MNRTYPPVRGATGRVLEDLAKSFLRKGWHVTIVTSGPESGDVYDNGIRIIRVKGAERPKHLLSYVFIWIKMLFVACRLKGVHLLVTMTDPPMLIYAGYLVSKFKRLRHIHWCQDVYPDVFPAMGYQFPQFLMRFMRHLRLSSMRHCEKIVVIGRCMARRLIEDGVEAQKISMIPNWPDFELVDPELVLDVPPQPEALEEEVARPFDDLVKRDQRFRVLYAGNMGRAHDVDTVLAAAKILQDRKADIEFVFVGEGGRFDYIAEERGRMHLDNIKLVPYQPASKLREMLETGDVHLISMKEHAVGYIVPCKLYAAFAVARPVVFVGKDQSETAQVIDDFKAGRVVEPDKADQLVDAILEFRDSEDVWNDAYKGALRARDVFTPYQSINAWIERAWDCVTSDSGLEFQMLKD